MQTSPTLKRLLLSASTIAMATSLSAGAYAQQQAQAQGLSLEEIVVTARKVEENLMTVPLAITAFSEKDIEAIGIKQITDIAMMTPSLTFVNQNGGSGRNERGTSTLTFRGLFLAGGGGGTVFIDGAPVNGGQPPAITDVERIEVLKGPQSAYFGRSTFLGAINFVIKDPANEFKGRVSAEASSFSSHDASISLEGPLVEDKLAVRVNGRAFVKGGYYTNYTSPAEPKLGAQKTGSVSSSLVFTPTDNFKAKGYFNWYEDNDGAPAQGALKSESFTGRANPDGSCTPFSTLAAGVGTPTVAANSRAALGYFCGTLPKVDNSIKKLISAAYDLSRPSAKNALYNPNPNYLIFDPQFKPDAGLKRHALQTDLRMDYETTGGYTLSSLSAYHREKVQVLLDLNYRDARDRPNPFYTAATDATRAPYVQYLLMTQNKSRDFSQELRVTSPEEQDLRFTLGGNLFDSHSPGGTVYGINSQGPNFSASITAQDISTPAVFGAAYYDFTEDLTLSLEARYQWDKITTTPKIGPTGLPVTGAAANPLKGTFKSFSPRVSLDYEYAENSTVYALFSRGYRPGGFNTTLFTASATVLTALQAVVPNAGPTFLQEKLDNYEAGIKSSFLDGRARTTVTIYYDKWLNGQVANSIPVSIPSTVPGQPPVTNLFALTVNNGLAALKGFELEGQFQATEGLKLSGTFALNDSEIKTYGLGVGNCADCNNAYGNFAGAIGRRLPTTPKYTWTATAEYTGTLTDNFDWYSRIDYQHRGSRSTDFSDTAKLASYENVNARIGFRNENFSVEAFVMNLTQNKEMIIALPGVDLFTFITPPFKNELRFSPPIPRAVGIRSSYNF